MGIGEACGARCICKLSSASFPSSRHPRSLPLLLLFSGSGERGEGRQGVGSYRGVTVHCRAGPVQVGAQASVGRTRSRRGIQPCCACALRSLARRRRARAAAAASNGPGRAVTYNAVPRAGKGPRRCLVAAVTRVTRWIMGRSGWGGRSRWAPGTTAPRKWTSSSLITPAAAGAARNPHPRYYARLYTRVIFSFHQGINSIMRDGLESAANCPGKFSLLFLMRAATSVC